jgi:hypothetical protein
MRDTTCRLASVAQGRALRASLGFAELIAA